VQSPWKAILAFVAVFIAGAVFGGVFTLRASGRRLADLPPRNDHPVVAPVAPVVTTTTTPTTPPAKATPSPVKSGQPAAPQPIIAAQVGPSVMRQFTQRLNLTAEQRKSIRPIIDRATEDWQRLRKENLENTARVAERMYSDIAEHLSSGQREQLEDMKQKMQERFLQEREKQKKNELVPRPKG
jgi:hypothetical protein